MAKAEIHNHGARRSDNETVEGDLTVLQIISYSSLFAAAVLAFAVLMNVAANWLSCVN